MESRRVSLHAPITLSDIALIVIAVFVILAFFKGWG
jgi:hypothetical protein